MRARDYRALARIKLSGHWIMAVITTFLAILIGGTFSVDGGVRTIFQFKKSLDDTSNTIQKYPDLEFVVTIIGSIIMVAVVVRLIQFVIGGFVTLGLLQYYLDLIDGKDPTIGVIFSKSSIFARAFWLRLRCVIFESLWGLLFVIPGIVKAYSYSMSGFIMAENPDITAEEAIQISMDMMHGNKFRLFCLEFSFIGWQILCALTFGIGILWLNPYMNTAVTEFYNDISREYEKRIKSERE